MSILFTDEERVLVEAVREYVARDVAPRAAARDSATHPPERRPDPGPRHRREQLKVDALQGHAASLQGIGIGFDVGLVAAQRQTSTGTLRWDITIRADGQRALIARVASAPVPSGSL